MMVPIHYPERTPHELVPGVSRQPRKDHPAQHCRRCPEDPPHFLKKHFGSTQHVCCSWLVCYKQPALYVYKNPNVIAAVRLPTRPPSLLLALACVLQNENIWAKKQQKQKKHSSRVDGATGGIQRMVRGTCQCAAPSRFHFFSISFFRVETRLNSHGASTPGRGRGATPWSMGFTATSRS